MSLIAVGSAKGSPGATILCALLARELGRRGDAHGDHTVLIDGDADGGDLVWLLDLDPVPGVATLTLQGRHGIDEAMLSAHAQRSPQLPSVDVLPGIAGSAQRPVLEWLVRPLLAVARTSKRPMVIDCGRLTAESAATTALLAGANRVLLVCRPDTSSLVHARSALASLASAEAPALAVIGGDEGGDDPRELADALGHPVAGVVPLDRIWTTRATQTRRARGPEASFDRIDRGLEAAVSRLASVALGESPPRAVPDQSFLETAHPEVNARVMAARRSAVTP